MGVDKKEVTLTTITRDKEVIVVEIRGGYGVRKKLADIGLVPGTKVKVVNRGMMGPIILALRNYRLAIGRGIAEKIIVR